MLASLRRGGTTQYTVNNQMVNATLMNIADNPTNVQLAGTYNNEQIPRVPIICTGNDFSTLYAPLIRDGRMDKFYWNPSRDDRIGVAMGIFKGDGINENEVATIVDTYPGQSIDFFGALRARVYDQKVRTGNATCNGCQFHNSGSASCWGRTRLWFALQSCKRRVVTIQTAQPRHS